MYKCQVIRLSNFLKLIYKEFISKDKYFSYFREAKSSESEFVLITSDRGKGCSASSGSGTKLNNKMNLDENCFAPSTIMHEFFHILGVGHYHQRSDRDKYVTIHWENIKPDKHFSYCKDRSGDKSRYGTDYDSKSFMHYEAHNEFALDQSKPTISSKVKFIL